MRLPAYLILVYIVIGLQVGLGDYLRVGGAAPNLVLLVVIFIAINAPREAALLGCFGIGVIQDLLSLQPLGLSALAYSLVAMFVVGTQEIVYREHPVTHFTLGLTGGCLSAAVLLIHGWIRGPRLSPTELLYSALYTGMIAPLVLGGLQRIRRVFSFAPRRRAKFA